MKYKQYKLGYWYSNNFYLVSDNTDDEIQNEEECMVYQNAYLENISIPSSIKEVHASYLHVHCMVHIMSTYLHE